MPAIVRATFRSFLPALAVLLILANVAGAGQAVVTASSLNVRIAPSIQANVIDQLPRGTQVVTVTADDGWVQIGYKAGTEARIGWVSARYLATRGGSLPTTGSDERSCDPDDAEVRVISADADDLDCDRAIGGDGYGECELEVEVEAARSCRTDEDMDVRVTCEAVLTGYEGRGDRFGTDYDEDEAVYFEIDQRDESAWADMEIEVDVEPISGVTTRVEGKSLDCRAFVD